MASEQVFKTEHLRQLWKEKVEFGQKVLGLDKAAAMRAADRTIAAINQVDAEMGPVQ